MKDFFVAVYTHEVKSYCDIEFFSSIKKLTENYELHIVDNTEHTDYTEYLKKLLTDTNLDYDSITNLFIPVEPKVSSFQRKVRDSVNLLVDKFLLSECKYFLIIESDVITPPDLLEKLESVVSEADVIGGIYYLGHHHKEWFDPSHNELINTVVFSGCTLYKKELLNNIKFRIDENNLGAFPDSLMSYDANINGYKTVLNTDIKCEHLSTPVGSRNLIRDYRGTTKC